MTVYNYVLKLLMQLLCCVKIRHYFIRENNEDK